MITETRIDDNSFAPEWADAAGYLAARPLTDDPNGEWLVILPMHSHFALAVCTPPPAGGIVEQWDYPADLEGAIHCWRALKLWPRRDQFTESWQRHMILDDGTVTQRRQPQLDNQLPKR